MSGENYIVRKGYEIQPYGPGTKQVALIHDGGWIGTVLNEDIGNRIITALKLLEGTTT